MRDVRGAVLVGLVLSAGISAQTPAPAARDGVITGQVVDALSGRPVGAAIVSITAPVLGGRIGPGSGAPPRILTGGDGRFVFRDLPAGNFTITATKGGYADGASGRRVIGGPSQPVVLTTAQKAADVAVRIWKNGAITGTIVDEAGEPIVGLQVRAFRRTFTAGRRRFVPSGAAIATDDRGVYRFSGMLPGEYLIAATPPSVSANVTAFTDTSRTGRSPMEMGLLSPNSNGIQIGDAVFILGRGAVPPPPVRGRLQVYPPTFHPSALVPMQATTVPLGSGEERIGVDLQLQPVPTVRVAGTLIGPAGPAPTTILRLTPAGLEDIPSEGLVPNTFSDGAGAFTFTAVPQGQYSLRATGRIGTGGVAPGTDMFWLDMPITVSGDDVDGVVAVMRPSLRITGRLEFEGNAPRPTLRPQGTSQFVPPPFTLEPEDPSALGGMAMAMAGSSMEQGFMLAGYAAGKYRVRVQNSPTGWMFKSATINGVDVSETPFEFNRDVTDLVLTYTDRWSGMGGVVQGAGAAGAMVLAFTTNAQAWENTGTVPRRLKSTRANAKGEFGLSSVPPGDYYVIAVPEEQAADWRDPKVLEALARLATQITIGEGEHKTLDLRIKEVRQ